jgi:signal transduction histidine kinase/ActR/RegA family two-component response regulator
MDLAVSETVLGDRKIFTGIVRDITERKRAEAERERLLASERAARGEAERSSRMKDEFLATLSHELRTPLNAIYGWSQMLQQKPLSNEDVVEGLAVIARNAKAQTQLIEDLLDMSRIVSGKLRMDVQRVNLADVIDAAVQAMLPAVEAKGIRLQKIVDPLAGPATGDPNRLQQVVWNLLSNAVKFTPRGGRVQVFLERVDSHVELAVTDTGEGFALELLPHLFERFRQADSSSTRRHGGLGLGLAIVRHLVELHGGSVRAASPGPGQGSTFTVVLPLRAAQVEEGAETVHAAARNDAVAAKFSLRGVKLLVVDDEPDARHLLKRLLGKLGADVLLAGTAAEGLELLRRERPDVLICDIGLPQEDGYAFLRRVRKLSSREGGDTPAVALTAYARSEDRTIAMLAGFQTHLPKPVEPAELLAVVANLAGRVGKG